MCKSTLFFVEWQSVSLIFSVTLTVYRLNFLSLSINLHLKPIIYMNKKNLLMAGCLLLMSGAALQA